MVGDEFAGFRLRAVLGRGGMSVVYQAENPRLGSDIALKVMAPELATNDAFRARFLEESRIAASLNHPNVIPIYDTGSSDGLLYIAMRFVAGTDMRQMIKKRGRIVPEAALFLLAQAARALDAAHRRGLAPGVSGVIFQTYPSLTALYAAYTAQVKSLNSGTFRSNFQDCNISQTYGEVGWNHMFKHPKTYSVSQMSAGMVPDSGAAGRVFCTFNNGQENFVWTQDDGHLLAYVTGPVHEDVWNWWYAVHHNIGFGGTSPMKM
jgi:hypothetical protein